MSTRLGRWGWLGPGARNGSKDMGFMAPPSSPLWTCRAPGAAREAQAMRPGATRLQGWRRLAPPLPLALTMRHELMGFGGPRPWKPNTRGDSIGKCGLWDGIGALTKEAPEGRARLSPPCADTARSGQSATRKGVSASLRSCERKTPVVYKPFHLWRHPETLWLPQPGEGAGTRGRANGI